MPDPAINPSAARYVPVARPSLGPAEATAVSDAILSGWASGGPRVAEFERQYAAAHGKRHGVTCSSGTTALHLALAAANVGPGDRVILPTLTMVAVANAVLYCGAIPIFVDSRPGDGNPDADAICDTKAVIVPHLYGVPAEAFLDALRRYCPSVSIIEDCAEAHYAEFTDGQRVGSRGDFACFSFYGNKLVTTGEGGMVCVNDDAMADRLRRLRAHCFTPGDHFRHTELAYGYRMTEMQGALGLVQHARRIEFIERRKQIAAAYIEGLRGLDWLTFQERTFGSAWWVFPVLADDAARRDRARAVLADSGIDTRAWFVPMHRQAHLRCYADRDYPIADDLSARGLYLPLYPSLSDDDVAYVVEAMRRV